MTLFGDCYRGRRVLVTGHTGFKGSWLCLWLTRLGAEVCGVALDPDTDPNHFELLDLPLQDHRIDIRDLSALVKVFQDFKPEVVLHLAAQPLVRQSYADPVYNWSTNVMGTTHVLEACRETGEVTAIIAVTTDKVYQNLETARAYRESDRLGGHDPYSASKAASEILIESYRLSFFSSTGSPLLASVRAGNVIGGGDWSEDRLIPDLVRALAADERLQIRSPAATRPWQHVLDCLSGYLLLGEKLLAGDANCAQAWNFGPDTDSDKSVAEVLELMRGQWPELNWELSRDPQPHEAGLLALDHSQASEHLGWNPVWGLDQAVAATAQWYQQYYVQNGVMSDPQLSRFIDDANRSQAAWAS